jgi:multiple sugar transport system substrate-binding protein
MRRATMVILLAALLAAAVAGTTAQARPAATKLTVWVGWSAGTELISFKKLVKEYDQQHADVDINVVGGINDNKIIAALRAGNAPDVVSSFSSQNVGIYCPSGGWIDLAPYLKKDHIDVNIFPAASRYYTQYNGKRCALPLLADVAGLYYNKALFRKAGIKHPPRTVSELTADAKKLTQRGKDGSLKVVGFDSFVGFYTVSVDRVGAMFGGRWTDAKGKSILAKDPAWARMLRWQKSLIDFYGYDKLVRFQAGLGDEFSASNAFEQGKLAMNLDGEWRVAFIKAEHPELDYGTAPLPVDDAHPELYGSSILNGSIAGIPRNAQHKDEAWKLLRYLATRSHPLAELANGLGNVPTTTASLDSPDLKLDPRFRVFLKIYANPHSATVPITAVGVAYQNLFTSFISKWQAGHVKDLKAGLRGVDQQIDAQLQHAGQGGPP